MCLVLVSGDGPCGIKYGEFYKRNGGVHGICVGWWLDYLVLYVAFWKNQANGGVS